MCKTISRNPGPNYYGIKRRKNGGTNSQNTNESQESKTKNARENRAETALHPASLVMLETLSNDGVPGSDVSASSKWTPVATWMHLGICTQDLITKSVLMGINNALQGLCQKKTSKAGGWE